MDIRRFCVLVKLSACPFFRPDFWYPMALPVSSFRLSPRFRKLEHRNSPSLALFLRFLCEIDDSLEASRKIFRDFDLLTNGPKEEQIDWEQVQVTPKGQLHVSNRS